MTCTKLHYLPLTAGVLSPLLCVLTYFIALQLDHIHPFFAYISDTGTVPPEMCVFALGLSILAVLIMGTVYIRYKQVEEYIKLDENGRGSLLNKTGLVMGLIAGVGLLIVGAFQETSQLLVHLFGAMMTFMSGSIFFIIQGLLTKMMQGSWSVLAYLRTMVGVICLLLFLASYSTGIASLYQFEGESLLKWEPKDGGWTLRVISTVTEWIMASLFDLYFLSFVPEFKRISCEPPVFRIANMSPEMEQAKLNVDTTTSSSGEPDLHQLTTLKSPVPSASGDQKKIEKNPVLAAIPGSTVNV